MACPLSVTVGGFQGDTAVPLHGRVVCTPVFDGETRHAGEPASSFVLCFSDWEDGRPDKETILPCREPERVFAFLQVVISVACGREYHCRPLIVQPPPKRYQGSRRQCLCISSYKR